MTIPLKRTLYSGSLLLTGFLTFCAVPALAVYRNIHVLPVMWDSRQNSEGWEVLLDNSGNDLQYLKQDVAGRTSENHAWDILRSAGLNRLGCWLLSFDNQDRSGCLNTFCFYEVKYKDYASLPAGFQWVHISYGNRSIIAYQKIDDYAKWALDEFLAHKAAHMGNASQPVGKRQVNRASSAVSQVPLSLTIPASGQQVAYNPMPPRQGWYAIPGVILFDRETEPSFALTNFYESPVQIPNYYTGAIETWPAVENYFQAMKTADVSTQDRLRGMSPSQALANKPASAVHWNSIRFDVMRMALEAKFAPGTDLGNMLLSTDGRVLVEKTCGRRNREAEWGADDGIQGKNHLGRLLMVIRDSLKDNTRYPYDPQNTYSLQQINAVLSNGIPLEFARE